MGSGAPHLTVIQGAKASALAPHVWGCTTCEADIGVKTSITTTVALGRIVDGAALAGGTEIEVCAWCLRRGKLTRAP